MKESRAVIIIPARYGSTRLPGKPLMPIGSKPMILHVLERARLIDGVSHVAVATDDSRILECVINAGGKAYMTDPAHPSGTDRIAEVARMMKLSPQDIVINVQGDQPLLDPSIVAMLIEAMRSEPEIPMATVACPMVSKQARDPNRVKVVLDRRNMALYFSRSVIPYDRDGIVAEESYTGYLRHLGLYAYRNSFLQTFVAMPQGRLEQIEKLEQLRALENGYDIKVLIVENAPFDVDTHEDLKRAQELYSS